MLRSDVMLETSGKDIVGQKQVEINSIASGFGWLGPASSMLHKYFKNRANVLPLLLLLLVLMLGMFLMNWRQRRP